MKEEKVFEVSQEIIDMVERLHYDYEGYKDIISNILEIHKKDIDDSFLNSKIFESYQHKAMEAYAAYNIAKGELEKKYMPQDGKTYDWNLDFVTNEITFTEV